jgi:hypothetical protein
MPTASCFIGFSAFLRFVLRFLFQLLLLSLSALNPLLLSKLFLGAQLQISAPRVFSDGELRGLPGCVPSVEAGTLPHSRVVPLHFP